MVPKVSLADPTVEPTDEELAALCRAARDTAYERHLVAQARFWGEFRDMLRASRERAGEAATSD